LKFWNRRALASARRPEREEGPRQGLAETDSERYLAIARIVRPQGRRGEVAAEILTDFPERFQALQRAFLAEPGNPLRPVALEHAWLHQGRIVLKFVGVDSIESADHLRGHHVWIPREERMQLPPHHYYFWELKGCRVQTERHGMPCEIGIVTEVEATGGVDLLHVVTGRGEVLIPLAQSICTRIDTRERTIVIDPPEDLLELNEPQGRSSGAALRGERRPPQPGKK
jgi:16S rRNA processing protein RimM